MKKIICNKGFALISVLLLATVFTILTTSMLYISTYHLQLIGNVETQARAMKAAEAGVEYAIGKLNDSAGWGLGATAPVNVKFPETNSEFDITFDKSKDYYSCNNLFDSNSIPRTKPPIGTYKYVPGYCLDVIVTGKCKGITKILRVILTRDDIFPCTLNADGKIMFKDAHTYIRGENLSGTGVSKSPGTVHSNWKDLDPNEPSIKKTYSSGSPLTTNRGFLSARGRIFDPNVDLSGYDCTINENLENKVQIGEIDIAQIINDKKGEPGIVTITPREINIVKTEWIEEKGDGKKEKHTEFALKEEDLADIPLGTFEIDKRTGLVTVLKNIYVTGHPENGTMNYNTQKDKWMGDLSVKGNSLFFKRDTDTIFTGSTVYDEIYGLTEIGTPYTAEYAKVDLNGHNIYSNSHVVMGVELIGQGSIITTGKLSYLQGATCDKLIAMSGDDLTIELARNTSVYQANGLFYSNDDITVKPIANDSPLNAAGTNETTIRNIYSIPAGKTTGSGGSAITVGKITGYEKDKDDEPIYDKPIYGGNDIVMVRVEEETGNSHIIIKPRALLESKKIELTYKGKVIDFGPLDLVIREKEGMTGGYEIGVMDSSDTVTWGDSAATIPGFPSNLSGTEFTDMGNTFGNSFYANTNVADLYVKGCFVSHNYNIAGDYNEGIDRLELDSGGEGGIIDITYDKNTYIKNLKDMRGNNLGVRIISWQEIK